MRRFATLTLLTATLLVPLSPLGIGGETLRLQTANGLALELGVDGSLAGLKLQGARQPVRRAPLFDVREVLRPDGKRTAARPFAGRAFRKPGRIHFRGRVREAALELKADFRLEGGRHRRYISVDGTVSDLSGSDRALLVRFNLPLELDGWEWQNTPFRARKVEEGKRFPLVPDDVEFLGAVRRGHWHKKKGPLSVPVNVLPCSAVVRGKAGLALAYPLHEPRAFLIEAAPEGYSISFAVGLTPETLKHPSSATFRFIIYPVEGAWGVRSALGRYRQFFPELYASRAERRHGNSVVFRSGGLDRWPKNPSDFGIVYAENDFQRRGGQMSALSAKTARELGLEVFHWRGPWYWFHEGPADMSRDAQLALLKAQSEGRASGAHGTNNQLCGCPDRVSARAAYNSHLLNRNGKLARDHRPRGYGQWLMPMNMNPELPGPNRASLALDWQFRFIKLWDQPGFRGPTNFAWDAIDDWGGFRFLNFRRSHFAYERIPVTFEPRSGMLCQVNGFTHWAFARLLSGKVRRRGGLIMANCNQVTSAMFCGQFIDVFFRERYLHKQSNERFFLFRAHTGRKPICHIGSSPNRGLAERENQIRRALLFGIAPGTRMQDEEREVCRKYLPVLARIGAAGWRPLTGARAEGLLVERFGEKPGELFFAVRNCGEKELSARMTVPSRLLGPPESRKALVLREIVEKRELTSNLEKDLLTAAFAIRPGETLVFEVSAPAAKP